MPVTRVHSDNHSGTDRNRRRLRPEALAGYGIGSRIEFLMSALIFGIGAAMTSIVGMSVGAGKFERAEQIGWVGAGISALLGGVIGVGLAVFLEARYRSFQTTRSSSTRLNHSCRLSALVWHCTGSDGRSTLRHRVGVMRALVMALVTRPTVAILSTIALIQFADLGLYGVYIGSALGMAAYSLILVRVLKPAHGVTFP